MALTAPVGAKTFYENGLLGLKAALEAVNGATAGKITILNVLPADIDAGSWAVCGAAGDSVGGTNVGSAVLGHAPIQAISGILAGTEEGAGENGWKLTFDPIDNVNVDTTGTAIAICLIVGRDTFAGGSDVDVRYIVDLTDIAMTSGTSVNIPTWDIEIEYGTNV